MVTDLNLKYDLIYQKVESLADNKRYLGAFVFGSYARGEQDKNSDFDVVVAVDDDNPCSEINHPVINGIKLDLSFRSLKQIESFDNLVVEKGERMPMLAESIIVFDKTGKLKKLKDKFSKIKRKKAGIKDYQMIQFMLYHADNKAKRNLKDDKATALLAMGININDILKFHYHINGRWWVSNKRLLTDLRNWDQKMAKLLEKFVLVSDVNKKYKIWTSILNYVAKPLGGRKKIEEINCKCPVCKKDLKLFGVG
jgi:predicted nucleotidyltransferase